MLEPAHMNHGTQGSQRTASEQQDINQEQIHCSRHAAKHICQGKKDSSSVHPNFKQIKKSEKKSFHVIKLDLKNCNIMTIICDLITSLQLDVKGSNMSINGMMPQFHGEALTLQSKMSTCWPKIADCIN
jgi:hypothetical protein